MNGDRGPEISAQLIRSAQTALQSIQWVTPSTLKQDEKLCLQVWVLKSDNRLPKDLQDQLMPWQLEELKEQASGAFQFYSCRRGPLWILKLAHKKPQSISELSVFAEARDKFGELWRTGVPKKGMPTILRLENLGDEALKGVLVGFGLSDYSFRRIEKNEGKDKNKDKSKDKIWAVGANLQRVKKITLWAQALAGGCNLARHLVNLPPADLNPKSYAQGIKKLFQGTSHLKVEVWSATELKRKKMGLHLAVGQGSVHPPCLVLIKYRPPGGGKTPIAFVGKGITFDTGGLNIKPANSMRLMKKDMGGSATVSGLCYFMSQAKVKKAADFYLALSENSISHEAFHPSDILTASNGKRVEIHNTDAEGRLVLGDALVQACKTKPKAVVDVATLTGAGKVALGQTIAGLFSNNKKLSQGLLKESQKSGDLAWELPLFSAYMMNLQTPFADMQNAASGYGGAITAALFLQEFVDEKTPWAHFDVYGWCDQPQGAFAEPGGNSQALQCLAHWVES